jgi:SET domain-containing protein
MTNLAQERIAEFSRFKLRVSSSKIHRLGVFAAESIPARAKVIEYSGKRLSRRQACEVFRERLASRSPHLHYLARVNSYWTVDGADDGSGAEFINHCCDPNLVMRTVRDHIWLISLRRIRRGEELSSDYAYDPKGIRVSCRCGSPNCRGTLNRL